MISSASGTASSVLRVSAFMQVHLQPVEDRAPPDAAIPRPQHPVSNRKSTRLNSSHGYISYAVFCLKKKKTRHVATHVSRPRDSTRFLFRLHLCLTPAA